MIEAPPHHRDPVAALPPGLAVARIGLAVGLLAYVLTRVDWSTVAAYRHTMSLPWLVGFVLLIPLGHLISSAKWQLLLRSAGHHVGLWRLMGLYVAGQFYNVVLPSTIGGDVVRSLGLRRLIGDTRDAFASTVAERVTGAAVLAALGALAMSVALVPLLSVRDGAIDGRLAAIMVLGAIVGITVGIVAMLSRRMMAFLRVTLPSVGPLPRWMDKLESFQDALNAYRHSPLVLGQALGWSLLFNAIPIALIYAGCRVTGAPDGAIGLLDAAVIMPIVMLVALLPLTPGGYGVFQWAYMVAFVAWLGGDAGDPATLGLSVSLIHAASNIVVAAIGYAIYTFYNTFEDRQKNEGKSQSL